MQRVTVTIETPLLEEVDAMASARGYAGRSEAVRDLLRAGLARQRQALDPASYGIATFTFAVDATIRELGQKLAELQGSRHDLVVSQMQVPLDHRSALHTMVLRGPIAAIRDFADAVSTQRGVRHDSLSVIPARLECRLHDHGGHVHTHEHIVM